MGQFPLSPPTTRSDRKRYGMTMLIATHEGGFGREFADEVCFRQAGRIVERGSPARIFSQPAHPSARRFLKPLIEGARG